MLPLGKITKKNFEFCGHCGYFYCYADDKQLYLSMISSQLANLESHVKDITNWTSHNFLMLNSNKTEVIVLGLQHFRDSLSNNIVDNTIVKNLVVIFDKELLFLTAHMLNRFQALPSFTSVILLNSSTFCLKKIQKNHFMSLLLPG